MRGSSEILAALERVEHEVALHRDEDAVCDETGISKDIAVVCESLREALAVPALPAQIWESYDNAVDKAYSVGAMKMLKNAQAAIGRWYVDNFNDQAVAKRAKESEGGNQ